MIVGAPQILEILDIIAFIFVVVTYTKYKKVNYLRVWLIGACFGWIWEMLYLFIPPKLWVYEGYSLYVSSVPLALPFAWGWWMICVYLLANGDLIKNFFVGTLVGFFTECWAVSLGLWRYTFDWFGAQFPLVLPIAGQTIYIMVFFGWGITSILNLNLAMKKKAWSYNIVVGLANGLLAYLIIRGVSTLIQISAGLPFM